MRFGPADFYQCYRLGRRLIRFGLRLCRGQEGFWFTHRVFHITDINLFAVQLSVSRCSNTRYHHQFGLVGRINQRQAGFGRSGLKHAFRQVATSLPERTVYHQQRFHSDSCD
ncbi:Uncharacterised protein [Serratia fonticola]|uniref:Uncharacterized protein n=1 Tax=Serratia fonticola TaxID=47917 RepID=A0A4U9URA3_SERFO|nr:Uncharacterised protein [Serratia fonticola]